MRQVQEAGVRNAPAEAEVEEPQARQSPGDVLQGQVRVSFWQSCSVSCSRPRQLPGRAARVMPARCLMPTSERWRQLRRLRP